MRAVLSGEEGRDEDEEAFLASGRRLGVAVGSLGDWFIAWSPRNGYGAIAEGDWAEWVMLARQILAVNNELGR